MFRPTSAIPFASPSLSVIGSRTSARNVSRRRSSGVASSASRLTAANGPRAWGVATAKLAAVLVAKARLVPVLLGDVAADLPLEQYAASVSLEATPGLGLPG